MENNHSKELEAQIEKLKAERKIHLAQIWYRENVIIKNLETRLAEAGIKVKQFNGRKSFKHKAKKRAKLTQPHGWATLDRFFSKWFR